MFSAFWKIDDLESKKIFESTLPSISHYQEISNNFLPHEYARWSQLNTRLRYEEYLLCVDSVHSIYNRIRATSDPLFSRRLSSIIKQLLNDDNKNLYKTIEEFSNISEENKIVLLESYSGERDEMGLLDNYRVLERNFAALNELLKEKLTYHNPIVGLINLLYLYKKYALLAPVVSLDHMIREEYFRKHDVLQHIENTINFKQKAGKLISREVTEFIVSEFNKIVHFDSETSTVLYSSREKGGIKLANNGKAVRNIRNFLSESETKRLALVILKAFVKFGDYQAIILDDPIDSYDDYYLDISCEYISDFLKEDNSQHDWFLFTNNVECLMKISTSMNCNCVVYSDNPDIFINEIPNAFSGGTGGGGGSGEGGGGGTGGGGNGNGSGRKPDSGEPFECTPDDIKLINTNELLLLSLYLNSSTKVLGLTQASFDDGYLPYLAFPVTIRNFRDVVIQNYTNKSFCTVCKKNVYDYSENISSSVECAYMHYNRKLSSRLEIKDFYDLYDELMVIDNANVLSKKGDYSSCENLRKTICFKPFNDFHGSKILNLILLKILRISLIKYEIEKNLIEKMIGNYSVPLSEVNNVLITHTLGRKKDKAISISRRYPAIQPMVFELDRIFSKYRTMINDFDHAFARMLPPYLATSFVDIKSLHDEVNNWISKY